MAERRTEIARQAERGPTSRSSFLEPTRMIDRFVDEMDRVFDDAFGRGWLNPRLWHIRSPWRGEREGWAPDIEVFHRDNELVVRADLPGLTKDDIKVNLMDNRMTLQGERKREHEEERGGVYRSECSYGSFYREIPLPEGAITDQAKASFKDGVLEVTMPAPPEQVRTGRRLEISEAAPLKR